MQGGSIKGDSASQMGVRGISHEKKLGNCGAEEAFLSLFWVKMSGFKLNFESQFDILNAIFCFNSSLYWHTKEKERQ